METAMAAPGFAESAYTATPRLTPIARSWNPLVWIALAMYGSIGTTTPVRVIFARAPKLILGHLLLVATSEYGLKLDRRVRALARVFGSRVNGCLFCDDLETRLAIEKRAISRKDADALAGYATSERFSEREKAALAFVEEVNTTRRASDETFATLRRHFSEREVVELTWLNAVGNYLNMMAKPLGLIAEGACELPASRSSSARA